MITSTFRRIALALSGALLTIPSIAQPSKPVYKSLLWEITGNGMTKPSYLYGTMHVSNKVAFHLTDTFYMGISNCDVIALEMNPDTWMADMIKSETVSDAADMMRAFGYYGEVKNFYQKSVSINVPDRRTIAPMFADDPSIVNGMLYRFNDYSSNYEEDTYLDLFIYQAAKKMKKRVSELEKFDESMEMMQKAMMPDEDSEGIAYNKKSYLNTFNFREQIEDAYRKGDLDLLDSLSRSIQQSKNYQKYLIDERNIIMARNMDSIMHRNTLFAAIGAAHLPGDAGVISLLRQKGYTVRPIANHVTRKSMQMKAKLERTQVPLTYTKQYSPDSVFSVDIPGTLYELPMFGEQKQYLYPEMMNGVYFSVSRIRTFSPLSGRSEEYIAKSIDSLLYESIPGKILKRQAITSNNQYKGYDIMSRTRRGDVLRYKVFVSPLEIFIFKMGGTGDYVKDEGEKFFSSIKFAASASGWKSFSSAGGGYEVELPAMRLVETNKGNYKGERQDEMIQALDPADNSYYMIMRSSLYDFSYIEEDTFELGQIADAFKEQLKLKEISRTHTVVNGHPAIDVKMKREDGYIHFRSILRGPHYFTLVARTTGEQEPGKFFSSFRFKEVQYEKSFESYTDTTLHFTVSTIVTPPSKSSLNPSSLSFLMNMYKDKSKKKEDTSYLTKRKKQTYYSSSTSEAILVKYTKFHKFYSVKNKETFWSEQAEIVANQRFDDYGNGSLGYSFQQSGYDNPLVIREKRLTENEGLQEMHLLLSDTNSARAIKAKMILKGGLLYTVLTSTDTLSKTSLWVSTFFETFTPADTLIGQSPFDDKATLFFSYLNGSDSTLKQQALKSAYFVNLQDKDAPELLKYMRTADFAKQDLDTRASFINILGSLKNAQVLPYLTAAYKAAADTATLQLAVLNALATHKTDKSFAAFIELFNIETPLTSNDYEVSTIFSNLGDSLQLAKKLFPALLDFTRYPEYENEVYGLLASLVDSGYVDKSVYAAGKASILKKANEELKRQLASEESMGSQNSDYGDGYEDDYYEDYYGYYYYGNYKLSNYSMLLMPYIQEPGVKAYFDKLAKSKDDNVRLSTSIMMLRKNMEVADSIWKKYSADEKFRITLYNQLKDVKRLDKFDAQYKTQLDFAKAQLYNGYFKDSLQFIEKRMVTTRNSQGYVYFFKSKRKSEEAWRLDYVGYMPVDEKDVDLSNAFAERGEEVFITEKEMNDEMDRITKALAMAGRKRMQGQDLVNYYQSLMEE